MKHIQLLDKIFNIFNGTKKDYFEARKLNEKKQQYYLNKFVFRQDVDLDGNIVTKTHNEFNEKVKEKISVDLELASKITFYDYTKVCWNCGDEVYNTDKFKMCPDYTCQTKYCDKCWTKCFGKMDNIQCYMCRKVLNKDFTVLDKDDQILFISDKYKDKIHPLETDRAKMDWDSSADSSDNIESGSESDESDSDDEMNSQSSEILFDFDSDDDEDIKTQDDKKNKKNRKESKKNGSSQPTNYNKNKHSNDKQQKASTQSESNKSGGIKKKGKKKWQKKKDRQNKQNQSYKQMKKRNFESNINRHDTSKLLSFGLNQNNNKNNDRYGKESRND